jgi:DNA-binding NtrC family response regulator
LIGTEPEIGLVLADFAMPEMNGVELTQAVRAIRPTLPVVLVTGYGDHEGLKEYSDSQILQKPYTEGDLMEKIAAALNCGEPRSAELVRASNSAIAASGRSWKSCRRRLSPIAAADAEAKICETDCSLGPNSVAQSMSIWSSMSAILLLDLAKGE